MFHKHVLPINETVLLNTFLGGCLKKKCDCTGCPAVVGNETASIICTKGGKTYLPLYSPESMSHGPIENKIWMSDG